MRRGEPRKLPPLTRSRGMIAASLLVVAVVATYASLAMLSLSVSAPGFPSGLVGNVASDVGGVVWHSPTLDEFGVKVLGQAAAPSVTTGTAQPIDFPRTQRAGFSRLKIQNGSTKAVNLEVRVEGALGVTAL